MRRDILDEVARGVLGDDDGEAAIGEALDTWPEADIARSLGFSNVEWTAYAHGVALTSLARWRVSGWPTVCPRCGAEVVPARFGWLARVHEGEHRLVHIACPS